MDWALLLEWAIKALVLIFFLLGGFAYLTWYERKLLARIQVRYGPNRAGIFGLLQPIADAVKLIFKEEFTPALADKVMFFLAPVVTVVPVMILAATIPWGPPAQMFGRTINLAVADVNVGVLYITSIASIAVYGIVLAGWSSNNKYAILGGLRASAQMISYELALGLSFVAAILLAGSMRIVDIVEAQANMGWFVLLQPVGAAIFFMATLSEIGRAPFDMPDAEQELSSSYHSEYSGMKFALFFMAEYEKMIVISMIMATLFFGGYREFWFLKDTIFSVDRFWFLGPFYLMAKVIVLLGIMIWIRATFPRIRYDRLMAFGWKVLLPLALGVVFITAVGILLAQEINPYLIWIVPIVSLVVGLFVVSLVDGVLRRKEYARI